MARLNFNNEAQPGQASLAWKEVVATALFDLELEPKHGTEFFGRARCFDFGKIQLVRFASSAMRYRRLQRHCSGAEPQILVSLPLSNEVEFEQFGRRTRCGHGQFLLEHSEAPYEFQYSDACDMWVLRVPEAMLQSRAGNMLRYCAIRYEARQGLGRLFRDYISLAAQHCQLDDVRHKAMIGTQLTDLLGAVLEADSRIIQSSGSAIKAAHMARMEKFIRENLADESLAPARIAAECNISVRYLHLLFKESGRTLAGWIRELRLQTAFELLQNGGAGRSVAQVAYHVGFRDHAQFSNAFRKRFGFPPSDLLRSLRIR